MRKQKTGRKLGKKAGPRKALFKSLANQLVENGEIETTQARAKELSGKIERMVTKAKSDNLSNRRILAKSLKQKNVKKMFEELGLKYSERKGGYTRIIKTGVRKGGASQKAIIQFV